MKKSDPEFEVLPPPPSREEEFVRLIAYVLDDFIRVPGTNFRVGLDPIISLIPGIGDTSTAAFGSLILVRAVRSGVPKVVIARMAINLILNALLNAIPVAGDIFSAWFKSNKTNYHLLLKHSTSSRVSTKGDWAFLFMLLALIVGAVFAAICLSAFFIYSFFHFLFGRS
ncbi:hypothetical protein BH09VER1_BH09VER1_41050 [soil metagenome]